MTFSTLKAHLKALPWGKKLNHSAYIIEESLTKVDETTGKIRNFNYDKSMNPPILHRKEVFLHPGHPQIEAFSELTKREESYGLYKNPGTISLNLFRVFSNIIYWRKQKAFLTMVAALGMI